MGCLDCKKLSPKNYDKCQKDIEYIKATKSDTSSKMYFTPCGTVFKFGAKFTAPKSKKRKKNRR